MKPRRTLWPYVPAAMLVTMVGGLLLLARIAADDPGFSVERDYYNKAVAWDAHREQERQNARLGWKVDLKTRPLPAGQVELSVGLADGRGSRIERAELEVEAFHNARASRILEARLDETDGGYRATLPMERAGLWELRFRARRGADTFTHVMRTNIAREALQ